MFSWFKRGAQFLGYESREVSKDAYELTIRMPDGSELVEQFSDPTALHNRQVTLESSGPPTAGPDRTAGTCSEGARLETPRTSGGRGKADGYSIRRSRQRRNSRGRGGI